MERTLGYEPRNASSTLAWGANSSHSAVRTGDKRTGFGSVLIHMGLKVAENPKNYQELTQHKMGGNGKFLSSPRKWNSGNGGVALVVGYT